METNVVMENYVVAIKRAYDIIRSVEALQVSENWYMEVDKVINAATVGG
ncbi:hypothetical protein [Lysinibacillus xylanilyticus]|nr:hypothetical protein [Lysinibacillus xylanilyticus]